MRKKIDHLEALVAELERRLNQRQELVMIKQRDDGSWPEVADGIARVIIERVNFKFKGNPIQQPPYNAYPRRDPRSARLRSSGQSYRLMMCLQTRRRWCLESPPVSRESTLRATWTCDPAGPPTASPRKLDRRAIRADLRAW